MLYSQSLITEIGQLSVFADESKLLRIEIGEAAEDIPNAVTRLAFAELKAYFKGELSRFSVPFTLAGTPFQQKVWKELLNIPYGEFVSYGDIAAAIGNPKASRAVGNANSRNPIPIIVPCHRVIAFDGGIGGYYYDVNIKKKLIELEKNSLYKPKT